MGSALKHFDHAVAECPKCMQDFRQNELGTDLVAYRSIPARAVVLTWPNGFPNISTGFPQKCIKVCGRRGRLHWGS